MTLLPDITEQFSIKSEVQYPMKLIRFIMINHKNRIRAMSEQNAVVDKRWGQNSLS